MHLTNLLTDLQNNGSEHGITVIQTLNNEMGVKNVGNTVQITLGKSRILYTNISRFEKEKTNKEVSTIFDIPPNTLSTRKKNKDKIFDAFRQRNLAKPVKVDTYYEINKAALKWFKQMRADNVPISGLLEKEKALYFAKELSFENFQASDGWLNKFKKKYGISFKTISGEAKSVNDQMIAPWLETTLPTILSRYPLENIFNADEFGGKHSKVCLTGIAAGNVKGERLSMFVFRKSKSPRCFKGVKNIPCCYWAQPKSWMLAELFEKWFKEIDLKFSFQKRKIALKVDNCSAHPNVQKLNWVELIFLPPNTTSITQPMDQGVIRSLKAKYRSLAVKKQIAKKKRTRCLSFLS
ncbi:tigger transposable element-derived protein 4-like [Hydra vulgaris]|uniref:Tigger transposable element-derived protein 4-like n=1 Tax=Hydra vulgaris TaxID=6087 RepID=A0ABM4D0L9_HYDVU